MNERATRMLAAAAALSAFAAVLANTANAYVPQFGEIGAWAVPSAKPLSQQTNVREKLAEIGAAWAVPSASHQKPLAQQTNVREKLAEIGAWAVPSISPQPQTPLATRPAVPDVDPSTFEGYRG